MPHRRRIWDFRVALVAALMLVLQSAGSAFALGANPAPQTDLFGNVLCVTVGGEHGIGSGDSGHAKIPDCCVAGCHMLGNLALAAPDAPSLDAPCAAILAAAHSLATDTPLTRTYRPGNPRAPPASV